MGGWLSLITVASRLLKLIDKITDEYLREKYKKLGRADLLRELAEQARLDWDKFEKAAYDVSKMTDEEVDKGLIDPRN